MSSVQFSVVVPVYNEEESLPVLFGQIDNVLKILGRFEIILVDDCSSDQSPFILKTLEKNHPGIIRVITLKERSGQTKAMRLGLDAVNGDVAITMDADLQNDPADIPKMIAKMKEGYDCVCGWRLSRQDRWLKARLSKFGNVMQRLVTGLAIHDVSCTLRVIKRECIPHIALNREGQHRFIPLSLSLQGYKIGEIVSNHRLRVYGQTKYNHKRIFKVVVDFFKMLTTRGKR